MSFYQERFNATWVPLIEQHLENQQAMVEAIRENTAAIREAARVPQRVVHVEQRGGHHAEHRSVPAPIRQR